MFILTAILLFLPMAQKHLRLFEFKPLTGVVAEAPQPEITLSKITSQELQLWTESHLKLNFGFRELLIRLYNQYRWDVFGQSVQLERKKLYYGDDGWLYESGYVEEYYHGKWRSYGKDSADVAFMLNEEAFRLYQLQHILEENGTHLFVLLLPGKELVYPEHVPQTNDFQGTKKISAYEFYGKKFKELGINHIDIGQWFLEIKDSVDYPLYPQTGIHWSTYATLFVADSIINYMEQLGGMKMQHFTIGEREEVTLYPDDDLEQLMNLLRPLPKSPNYYATSAIVKDSTAFKPMLITIGDSYYWNLVNHTPFGYAMRRLPYWYYYHTVYFDDPHKNIEEVDVMEQVLDADFVMLAYNTVNLYKMSQGFSQELLLEICCDEKDLAEAQRYLVKNIQHNSQWMESLTQKAELYQIPIDSIVVTEAKNHIQKYPELFVPALKDSIPTHRSKKYQRYIEKNK